MYVLDVLSVMALVAELVLVLVSVNSLAELAVSCSHLILKHVQLIEEITTFHRKRLCSRL